MVPMLSLTNKRVILGITGGIAAYKCAELTRLLAKAGAEVRVAMTKSAVEFITPLTMQALSGNRVHLDLLDTEAEAAMGHIELARWADLVMIAPATADFIARIVHGHADNILSTLVLATSAPIAIAPAMNQAMWADDGTQANLQALKEDNFISLVQEKATKPAVMSVSDACWNQSNLSISAPTYLKRVFWQVKSLL